MDIVKEETRERTREEKGRSIRTKAGEIREAVIFY